MVTINIFVLSRNTTASVQYNLQFVFSTDRYFETVGPQHFDGLSNIGPVIDRPFVLGTKIAPGRETFGYRFNVHKHAEVPFHGRQRPI